MTNPSPIDIQSILADPAKVLVGIQRLIESHIDMPPINSSALAMLVVASYLDQETVNAIVDTVPPHQKDGLIEFLALLSKAPPGIN